MPTLSKSFKCEQIKGNAIYLCLTFNHDISGFLIQKLIFLAIKKVFLGPGTLGALLTFWTSCSVGRCYSFLVKVGAVYVFKILLVARVSVARGSVSDPDPVGSAFKLGLDPGSGSVFGIRIRIPDPGV
jgi:hypothetical protein